MANKWVTHDHSNYPPGGPLSATYLADADEFNQNYQDICDAVGARYVRGIACADKNSTESRCVPSASVRFRVVDVPAIVKVSMTVTPFLMTTVEPISAVIVNGMSLAAL